MATTTWRPLTILRREPVPLPQWTIGIRALQKLFALISIGLLGYSLNFHGGSVLQPPLISQLLIAIFTIFPIFFLTTPLLPVQRTFYDPRVSLVADGIATLWWLSSTAALAAYLDMTNGAFDIANDIADDLGLFDTAGLDGGLVVWRCATAAAVFGGFEFLLFGLQTLIFTYHYHIHLAGHAPVADSTVPYGVPTSFRISPLRTRSKTSKTEISNPTAFDPVALEERAAVPAPSDPNSPAGQPKYKVDPVLQQAAAITPPPPPPPPAPKDSPLARDDEGDDFGAEYRDVLADAAGALPVPEK